MQEDFSPTVLAPSPQDNVWGGKKMDELGGPWSSRPLLEVTQITFRSLGDIDLLVPASRMTGR